MSIVDYCFVWLRWARAYESCETLKYLWRTYDTMKYIVTVGDKEMIIDETHICTENSPLKCTKIPEGAMKHYIEYAWKHGYNVEGVS